MPEQPSANLQAGSQTLQIGNIAYHLSTWGEADAPLVIFLHGWGDTGTSFQFVVEEIADVCRFIAPDLRGFGKSTVANGESFWFPDYLADLDALLDHLSPDAPVRLVGQSMGANIAGLYAGVRPDRVHQFINVEGFGLPDSEPADAPSRYLKWLNGRKASMPFREFPDFLALAQYLKRRFPGLNSARAEFIARCWGEDRDGVVRLRVHPAHRLPNPVLYRRREAEACWRKTTADYLLVTGDGSEYATPDSIDAVLRQVPHAEHAVIKGAGHMVHFDTPRELADEIKRFLRL